MKKIVALSIISIMILAGCSNSETPTVTSSETTVPGSEPSVSVTDETTVESIMDPAGVEPMEPPTESEDLVYLDVGAIDEDLIGTWSYSLDTVSFSYVFYDDGTGTIIIEDTATNYYDDTATFEYSADGEALIIDRAPDNDEIMAIESWSYIINEDTMECTDSVGNVTTFTR